MRQEQRQGRQVDRGHRRHRHLHFRADFCWPAQTVSPGSRSRPIPAGDLRSFAGGAQPDPAGKIAWSNEEIRDAVTLLSGCTVRVQPGERLDVVDADPDDNRVLECAVAAGSRFIVTGDGDLLRLGAYAGIRNLKLADFLGLIREPPA
ncbi:MAG: PIN domain-containing protein [Stellaceae bacterium]